MASILLDFCCLGGEALGCGGSGRRLGTVVSMAEAGRDGDGKLLGLGWDVWALSFARH